MNLLPFVNEMPQVATPLVGSITSEFIVATPVEEDIFPPFDSVTLLRKKAYILNFNCNAPTVVPSISVEFVIRTYVKFEEDWKVTGAEF